MSSLKGCPVAWDQVCWGLLQNTQVWRLGGSQLVSVECGEAVSGESLRASVGEAALKWSR